MSEVKIHCLYDELVDVEKLTPHPRNTNRHPVEQIIRLGEIIQYQGWRYPIKVSKLSGYITSGHGRLDAAMNLGLNQVPVNYQDYENEQQELADLTSDNAIALWAEIDIAEIYNQIDSTFGADFKIDLLGLENFEVKLPELIPQADEDEVPEVKESKVVKGDIFILGHHRLMCGDSTMVDDVEKLMDGQKADMVFTDPPYGYKYESNHQDKHTMLMNDDVILDFMSCAYTVMSENSAIYICGSHQTIHKWRELVDQHFDYKNLIVWKKNNWSMGDLKGAFAGQHELIIFAHKGRVELRGGRDKDVWEFDRDPPKHHPTQKPIPLIEFAIEKSSEKNASVMDLFGGSGSTLIASEKTNRKCFMMELDPVYCAVILERWQKFTGKKAEHVDGRLWDEIKGDL
jgi:DNA modification methylase